MSAPCEKCPCPATCLRRAKWCEWMAGSPSEIEVRAIVERSQLEVARKAYPPLATQAGNLMAAAGRIVAAVAAGGPVVVPQGEFNRRMDICMGCEFNGERGAGRVRCTKCGCGGAKLQLATEACPVAKWGRWENPSDDERSDDRPGP